MLWRVFKLARLAMKRGKKSRFNPEFYGVAIKNDAKRGVFPGEAPTQFCFIRWARRVIREYRSPKDYLVGRASYS